jgi:hypothetical protein
MVHTTAQAQAHRAAATIPFDFHVHDVTLPAGSYVLEPANASGVIRIANADTGRAVLLMTAIGNKSSDDTPRLGFMRYGSDYFLRQIQLPELGATNEIRQTPREKELASAAGPIMTASVRVVLR